MDGFDLPEDLEDIEVIYSDGEDGLEEGFGEDDMVEDENFVVDNADEVPVIDLSKLTFTKHTKSVFSCDLSEDHQLAVTGGEDESAFVWSTISGEVVLECTGHKDSVTEVSFNHNSQLVATGDMAGLIQVWDMNDKKLIWCYEGDDMEWLKWHPVANVLMSGSQSGDIYIWQVPQGHCKVIPSHGAACTYAKVLPDGKRIIAGYSDGHVTLWDIKSTSAIWHFSDPQNTGVTSLDLNSDASLLSIAPTSNIIKISDGKQLSTLLVAGETEIESHAFNSELNVLITGSLSGQLCVWDLARQTIRHQAAIECAVTVLKLGLNGKVFIGATDGAIYVCDAKSGTLVETLTGHKADVLSLCISEDGTTVLSTSDDGTAKMFTVKP